jgi:hypothetical protein
VFFEVWFFYRFTYLFISEKIFTDKTLVCATGAGQSRFSTENRRVLDVIIFGDIAFRKVLFLDICTTYEILPVREPLVM